ERAFFFQAEDGIRDRNVTGVQTCALPIYSDTTTRRAPRARRAVTASPRVGEAITAWADTTSRHGPRPASSAAMVEMTALAFGSLEPVEASTRAVPGSGRAPDSARRRSTASTNRGWGPSVPA